MIDGAATPLVVSDETWETKPGPITFNGVYGGEDHDARLEEHGWDIAPFKPSGTDTWQAAVKANKGTWLRAQATASAAG